MVSPTKKKKKKSRTGCTVLESSTERVFRCTVSPPPLLQAKELEMAALLLLLFSVGALFSSSDAQDSYRKLPDVYRQGVDVAVDKINTRDGMLHHFLFFRTVTKSKIESGFDVSYIYHNFYLKATKCRRGTADSSACQFRNDRPLIDCAVCYKTFGGQIEPEPAPYVHCIHKPVLTEEIKAERVEHCNRMAYNSGALTLLASTGTN
uniref:Retinoic acid receptor responder protein 2 n=1 Tax=Echeneis naucrates TaxID=173247 RepID=A0A665UAC8_ECHNA